MSQAPEMRRNRAAGQADDAGAITWVVFCSRQDIG